MINLGGGNDTFYGHAGDDQIHGQAANDLIYGQTGNDNLDGGNGNDTLYGGSGNDIITGNNDADIIYGGSGADTIDGGNGNDLIVGGYGADTLTGGTGADTFKFLDIRDTGDTITDFSHIDGDKLDFSAIAGITGSAVSSNTVTANSINYFQDGSNTIVWADTDGNTSTVEIQITLTGVVAADLTAANIVV